MTEPARPAAEHPPRVVRDGLGRVIGVSVWDGREPLTEWPTQGSSASSATAGITLRSGGHLSLSAREDG